MRKGSKTEIRKQLESCAGTRKKVQITRALGTESRHNGFVIAAGSEWVLLHQFHDFYPDGFAALRIKDIVGVRSGEYERHWERMLKAEGILDQIPEECPVKLETTAALLKSLQKKRDANVVVECEAETERCNVFYIGRILRVGTASLKFANFDALGNWDETASTISLSTITKIQFDTNYARVFSKYLTGTPAI